MDVDQAVEELKQLDLGLDGHASEHSDGSTTVKAVEEKTLANGRKLWKETLAPGPAMEAESEVTHVKDWSKEESLLD